jgi:cellulose biosynthesis protein BcsQ
LLKAAQAREAQVVLIDVGPNLGAINRAAILAARHVVIPLAPDLFSLQGLRNLGPTLRSWRGEWGERLKKNPDPELVLPDPEMRPAGYVLMQHAQRFDRPVQAYAKWMRRIPGEYRAAVLDQPTDTPPDIDKDPYCLDTLKNYRSLMPMAMEASKPMFFLKPADGAIGSHARAVRDCYRDFQRLTRTIADRCGVSIP